MKMPRHEHEFSPAGKGAEHTRVTARESFFLAATVRFEGEPQAMPVRIRNLSAGGMMIDHAVPRDPGLAVAAELKTIGRIDGKVAWSGERRMGINFDRPIDPQRARLRVTPEPPAPKKTRRLFPS